MTDNEDSPLAGDRDLQRHSGPGGRCSYQTGEDLLYWITLHMTVGLN